MAAIAIPVLLVIAIALSIYLPAAFAKKPKYDFVYTNEDDYYYRYTVKEEKIIELPQDQKSFYPLTRSDIKFYLHNTAENTNKEITLADAQSLNLSGDTTSPDGFTITRPDGNESIFTLFFGGVNNYNSRYFEAPNSKIGLKINLANPQGYYFHFLGWVIK